MLTNRLACWNRDLHGQETNPRSQDPCAPAGGLLTPSSRAGYRRIVFDPGVFRSARPGPGQVRDATPGAKRGTNGEPSGSQFWLLASLVLSRPGRLPARRSAGLDGAEARTKASPQTHRRSVGLLAPRTAARSLLTS